MCVPAVDESGVGALAWGLGCAVGVVAGPQDTSVAPDAEAAPDAVVDPVPGAGEVLAAAVSLAAEVEAEGEESPQPASSPAATRAVVARVMAAPGRRRFTGVRYRDEVGTREV